MGTVKRKKRFHKKPPMKHKNFKKLIIGLIIALVASGVYFKAYPYTKEAKVIRELETTSSQLQQIRSELESERTINETELLQKQQELEQINKKLEETEAALQAKRKTQKAAAAEVSKHVPSCGEWMAQAGIPINATTQKLIINESGCKPHAVNKSSGACGIPQALPCSKLKCPLNDSGAVCQLKWMDGYVKDRYGSWESALSFWYAQCPTSKGCWY